MGQEENDSKKVIPGLNSGELNPLKYAQSTCFKAGYLTTTNAGWRNIRPLIDTTSCTGCLQCYMYCPDGTIFKIKNSTGEKPLVAVDLDFCKGCGICAKVCKFDSIHMISEREAQKNA